MIKATFLASAAAALALAATPALAKDNTRAHAPTAKSQKLRHSSSHHATPHHRMKRHERVSRMDRGSDWDRGNWNRRSGFWPADTAAGIASGAVNTAGAIATGAIGTAGAIASAPFRGPYYDNDYYVDQRPYGMAYTPKPYASPRYRYGNTYASVDDDFGGYVGGSYDYSGTVIPGSPDYAARNGFSCRPGSLIKMNGQTTVCQ